MEDPKAPSLPVGRLGPYRPVRRIGRGGMAEVFLAEAVEGPRAGRLVALKRLRPEAAEVPELVDGFLGEADLSRLIRHPNLVEVYEAGTVGDVPYLVMEYVDGRDLSRVLHRCRELGVDLPVPFCTHLAGRLLEALGAVHQARGRDGTPLGVVHCDVNPANVFISRLGGIKLGDLGVAMVGALAQTDLQGEVRGKIAYLAPEQAVGGRLDARTDLYGAGAVLYELLTLDRPMVAESLEELMAAFTRGGPWPPSALRADVPEGLEAVVMRLLAADPEARPADAAQALAELAPYRDDAIGNDLAIASVVRGLFPR